MELPICTQLIHIEIRKTIGFSVQKKNELKNHYFLIYLYILFIRKY